MVIRNARRGLFAALTAAVLLSACVLPPNESATGSLSFESLNGIEWVAVAVDGVIPVVNPRPQLRWTAAGRVAGTGGCNAFVGKAVMADDSARFGPLAATGKACMTAPNGQEDRFFKALEETRKARIDNGELFLQDDAGKTLVRLVKAK